MTIKSEFVFFFAEKKHENCGFILAKLCVVLEFAVCSATSSEFKYRILNRKYLKIFRNIFYFNFFQPVEALRVLTHPVRTYLKWRGWKEGGATTPFTNLGVQMCSKFISTLTSTVHTNLFQTYLDFS